MIVILFVIEKGALYLFFFLLFFFESFPPPNNPLNNDMKREMMKLRKGWRNDCQKMVKLLDIVAAASSDGLFANVVVVSALSSPAF